MIQRIRHSLLTSFVLTGLSGVALLSLAACKEKMQEKPLTGAALFVQTCSTPGKLDTNCQCQDAIEKAFGFDLMAEINDRYQKMKKTATDISAGKLTDDQYKTCLAVGTCVEVPMLDDKMGEGTPHARDISRTFWELVDGHALTLGICKHMPVCAVALENGALVVKKGKVIPVKAGTP